MARIPCSDDMCTGIVGPDGKCGYCGRLHLEQADESVGDEAVPCPDDMCVGVLDSDGVCGTCGVKQPSFSEGESFQEDTVDPGDDRSSDEPVPDEFAPGGRRIPCSDDMCTGIVGPDGRCGYCHKLHPEWVEKDVY